jgi:hypothetical protein
MTTINISPGWALYTAGAVALVLAGLIGVNIVAGLVIGGLAMILAALIWAMNQPDQPRPRFSDYP